MGKIDFLTAKITEKKTLSDNFFDLMYGPPVRAFFTPEEHNYIKSIVYKNRNDYKIKMLNAIMKSKGFSRLSGGTNRMVYRYLDDPSFVLKIAIDRVGMNDNIAEFKNQRWLKPYVCKVFDTTDDGLMATIERVIPITSKEEFKAVQEEVFYLITTKLIGRTVAEDIGKNYFRNYGIRPYWGVVLLDYPYIYKLDGNKLFCTHINPDTGVRCTGIIDYDDGFNHLFCRKCGTRYLAVDLEDKNPDNDIINARGGKYPMKVRIVMSDGSFIETLNSSSSIYSENKSKTPVDRTLRPVVVDRDPVTGEVVKRYDTEVEKKPVKEEKVPEIVPETKVEKVEEETVVKIAESVEITNIDGNTDIVTHSTEETPEETKEEVKEPEKIQPPKEEVKIEEKPQMPIPDIIPNIKKEYPAKKNSKSSKSGNTAKAGSAKKAGTAKKAGEAKKAGDVKKADNTASKGVSSNFIPSPKEKE